MIVLWSTLRHSNITMENPPFVNEFPIGNGGISIATMLDYWSVILFELCCYKVPGRSWFSSLRSTHTHTHITVSMAISFTFRDQRFRFSGVFWYDPVKASSWQEGALPSRENCRLLFSLGASSELGPFFLESSSNDSHLSEPQLALHLKKTIEAPIPDFKRFFSFERKKVVDLY